MTLREILQGKHNNKTLWVCKYDQQDFNKKPIRVVPPTKVLIRGNNELTCGKRVYDSESHFVVLNKKGKPTKRIIAPYDNQRWGNTLLVFDNERECEMSWNKQIDEHLKKREEYVREVEYRLVADTEILTERKVYGFTCEDCGKTDDTVEKTICPYQKELYNEIVKTTLCTNCEGSRSDDI